MRLWAAVLLLLCSGAKAQTISPVIVECGLKCSGEFKVTNNSAKPIIAVLDVYSFKVVDGKPVQRPLDAGTSVKLDQTSTRLSPMGEHVFTYKIFCDQEPCMTQIVAGFAAGKTKEGALVMMRLPETVYSCKSQKNCRAKALGIK
jgi:hypothetical protein